MIRRGTLVVLPLVLFLFSAPGAFALVSYSEMAATLQALSGVAHTPDGPRLQVVRIGATTKGRDILMAVLSGPQTPEDPATDAKPSVNPPAPAADPGQPDANPAPPAAAPAAADKVSPDGKSIVLTLEPANKAPVPPVSTASEPSALPAPEPPVLSLQPVATRRVLFICRQHGNEPASTEAAMQFLKEYATTTDPEKLNLLRRVTFMFVPMLNADGAEAYQRHNGRDVDLNRDWVKQSQPETQAVVRMVREWHPQLIVDLHELATSDGTGNFAEGMEVEAGPTAQIGDEDNAAIAAVVGPLREQAIPIYARPVNHYREPRLAHRYFSIKEATPSILIETHRAGGVPIERRAAVHYAAIVALGHYLAGDKLRTPSRIIDAWLEPGVRPAGVSDTESPAALALAARERSFTMASRGGDARSVAKKRAALAAKRRAAAAAKKRAAARHRHR